MSTNNSVNSPLSGTTGTGSFVGSTSPTLVTPNIDTPSAGVLTNCTGLPLTGLATTVTSNTYTPSLTNVGNIGSSTSAVFQYMQIGSVVTVSGVVSITPNATGAGISLGVSLPVASNFTTTTQCSGTFGCPSTAGYVPGNITADTVNHRAICVGQSGDTSNRSWSVHFSYSVV